MKRLWITLLGASLALGFAVAPATAAPVKVVTLSVKGMYVGTATVAPETVTIGATLNAVTVASHLGLGSLHADNNVFADGGPWTFRAIDGSTLSGVTSHQYLDDSGALVLALNVVAGTGRFAAATGGILELSGSIQVFDPNNGFAAIFATKLTGGTISGQVIVS